MPEPLRAVTVVDDNARDIELFTIACEMAELPVSITAYTSGKEAIAALQRISASVVPDPSGPGELPRVIFLDLNMPGVTGLDVLAFLMSDARLRTVPTCILTTSSAPRDRELCARLGATHYLIKPSTFTDLVALLKDAVGTALREPGRD